MNRSKHRSPEYEKNSLSLLGAVAMGTGVMIGAGIFALTGQVAELARGWFPLAFLAAAAVAGFSAYSYVKMSNAYPSAGGIAMFLKKAYGETMVTGAAALLMYFSMVINESLVARTFGTYSLQLFDIGPDTWLVPALGVGLLGFAFLVNILGNRFIESFSFFTAFIKIAGITLFALTVFFDLSRIASLGAIFYLIMDIAIHWGVLRHLRHEIDAKASVLVAAIVLDLAVLAAFVVVKAQTDLLVIWAALLGLTVIVAGERYFVRTRREDARGG